MNNRMNFQWDDHDGGLGEGYKPTRLDRIRVWLDPEIWDVSTIQLRWRIKRIWRRLLGWNHAVRAEQAASAAAAGHGPIEPSTGRGPVEPGPYQQERGPS